MARVPVLIDGFDLTINPTEAYRLLYGLPKGNVFLGGALLVNDKPNFVFVLMMFLKPISPLFPCCNVQQFSSHFF